MIPNTNRYTIITGASYYIEYETAKTFATHGNNLTLIAYRKNKIETLRQEILTLHPTLDI